MRRLAESAFETRTGGTNLITWIAHRRGEGASLRNISDELSATIGMRVSHETIRRWLLDG